MFTKEANKFMYNKVGPTSARRPVRGTSSYHSKSNSSEMIATAATDRPS